MANPGAGSFPQAAIEWLAPADPGSVLAVGTGSLPTALRYARRGHRITLVDKDGGQLGRIADRHPDLLAVVAAPEALPFAAHSYDQVLVAQGLHLLAPGLALAEFARVLGPNGLLVVVTPTASHLEGLRQRYGLLAIEPDKDARLARSMLGHFVGIANVGLDYEVEASASVVRDLIAMGPNAFHAVPESVHDERVRISVTVSLFRKQDAAGLTLE